MGIDNIHEITDPREILRSDVEKIMEEERELDEKKKTFLSDFSVDDISPKDLELYMKFKDKKLADEELVDRNMFFRRVTPTPSQIQLLLYISKNFKS